MVTKNFKKTTKADSKSVNCIDRILKQTNHKNQRYMDDEDKETKEAMEKLRNEIKDMKRYS